jgi:hypothetical protein
MKNYLLYLANISENQANYSADRGRYLFDTAARRPVKPAAQNPQPLTRGLGGLILGDNLQRRRPAPTSRVSF